MSRTLNLVDFLLTKARRLHDGGFESQAEMLLGDLTRNRNLAPPIAEEIHARLGRICLHREEYRQARRHLSAALAHAPENAAYHHLLGVAHHDDPRGDENKAHACLRRALKLAPSHAQYLADFGLFALDTGRRDEAIKALRQACESADSDADLVSRVVDGLLVHDEVDEARALLRAAMFRHPRDSRYRNLLSDLQFHILAARQQEENEVAPAPEQKPVILPFLRCVSDRKTRSRPANVRRDQPATRKGPHLPKHLPLPDKQHA